MQFWIKKNHTAIAEREDTSHLGYSRPPVHLTHPEYRPYIDGLRAVAVLSVVCFHALPGVVRGGFIGVDIFFVISGFLIATIIFSSLERDAFSFRQFYSRRIRRIFPALLVILIFCYVYGWFELLPNEFQQLGANIAGGAGFISNFVLLNEENYFDRAAQTKPLLHLWSLGVEEQFYIAWPLLLWLAWKWRSNFFTVTITIALISFILNFIEIRNDSSAAFYSPITRFWELLAGSALAYSQMHELPLLKRWAATLHTSLQKILRFRTTAPDGAGVGNTYATLGALLIGFGFMLITKRHFSEFWMLLPVLGTVMVIAAGKNAWLNRAVLSNHVLVWFGLISYPLYLWHWPLLAFAFIHEDELPDLTMRIFAVALSIILAWLTFRLVEKPLRFGQHETAKTMMLVVLMAATGYVGYYTFQQNGVPSRLPEIIQKINSYPIKTVNDAWRAGYCYLGANEPYSMFSGCVGVIDYDKPTILLWGDSNAAQLYPGILQKYHDRANIIEFTTAGCPPIIRAESIDDQICNETNNFVLSQLSRIRPTYIVLAACWPLYDWWKKIEKTVVKIRQNGFNNIIIVGPVPQWQSSLPKQLTNYYYRYRSVPRYMIMGLIQEPITLDPELEALAKRLQVRYVSPLHLMCNEQGCITRVNDNIDSITAFDAGHLTIAGSLYLLSKFDILEQNAGQELPHK